MDGLAADFEEQHQRHFGFGAKTANKLRGDIDWDAVNAIPNFFRDIPMMPDFPVLWEYVQTLPEGVFQGFLTGVPKEMSDVAARNKREWIDSQPILGPKVRMTACRSREKFLHGIPGDILADDWDRYEKEWTGMGGLWVLHTSAEDTIRQLRKYYNN